MLNIFCNVPLKIGFLWFMCLCAFLLILFVFFLVPFLVVVCFFSRSFCSVQFWNIFFWQARGSFVFLSVSISLAPWTHTMIYTIEWFIAFLFSYNLSVCVSLSLARTECVCANQNSIQLLSIDSISVLALPFILIKKFYYTTYSHSLLLALSLGILSVSHRIEQNRIVQIYAIYQHFT